MEDEGDGRRLPDITSAERTVLAGTVRAWLRKGLSCSDARGALLQAAGDIGRQAIESSSCEIAKAARLDDFSDRATQVLDRIARLGQTASAGEARPRGGLRDLWRHRAPPPDAAAETMAAFAASGSLRDDLLRTRGSVARRADALREAEAALVRAALLIRETAGAVKSAARELASDWLAADVAAAVQARAEDIFAQLVVTRQALLALDILRTGHATLLTALERGEKTMIAAMGAQALAREAVHTAQVADAIGRLPPAEDQDAQAARLNQSVDDLQLSLADIQNRLGRARRQLDGAVAGGDA